MAILVVIFSLIVFVKYRKRSLLKKGAKAERSERYLDAINYYLRADIVKAVKLAVESPRGTQILLNRQLQRVLPRETRIKTLEKVAKEYKQARRPHYASSAYLLAENVIKAAEVYILSGFAKNAIEIMEKNPHLVRRKDEAIRQLSKFAYENGRYFEAMELLKNIGAHEEASAVLTAAADNLRRSGKLEEAERLELSNAPNIDPQRAMQDYLRLAAKYFLKEDMENARTTITMVKQILDHPPDDKSEIKDLSSIKLEYNRMTQVMRRLEIARDLLRQRQLDQARAHYAEIVEIASDLVPATVFAEAGLAYENYDNQLAADYYTQAAAKSEAMEARNRFLERARTLKTALGETRPVLSSPSISIMSSLESERCVICKRKIKWDESYVRCPECDNPAHYAHLAEWLKIKGVCPACQKKIRLDEIGSRT
jgi:tetratricopeptide (TPR) repeat protein